MNIERIQRNIRHRIQLATTTTKPPKASDDRRGNTRLDTDVKTVRQNRQSLTANSSSK